MPSVHGREGPNATDCSPTLGLGVYGGGDSSVSMSCIAILFNGRVFEVSGIVNRVLAVKVAVLVIIRITINIINISRDNRVSYQGCIIIIIIRVTLQKRIIVFTKAFKQCKYYVIRLL